MPQRVEVPDPEDPQAALAAVVALRRLAGRLEEEAVTEAVARGWTWAEIGQALDVSPQAAHKKHASRVRGRPPHARADPKEES
jgi:hypothetical protein